MSSREWLADDRVNLSIPIMRTTPDTIGENMLRGGGDDMDFRFVFERQQSG